MVRKVIALLVIFVFAAGLSFISTDDAYARRKDKKEAKVEEVVPPTADEPKLIYSFKSDEELAEFEQLYISKQATFGRMGVLQAYFGMEQNNLTEIDKQLNEKYGFTMDPSKMYDLNRDTMEISEVGVAPVPAPALAE